MARLTTIGFDADDTLWQNEHFYRLTTDRFASLLGGYAAPDRAATALMQTAAEAMKLSARGYHRVLKVARTLADLDGADGVGRIHLAEALSYRVAGDRIAAAA